MSTKAGRLLLTSLVAAVVLANTTTSAAAHPETPGLSGHYRIGDDHQGSSWSPDAHADAGTVRTVAGNGTVRSTDSSWNSPADAVGLGDVGPDGSYYVAEPQRHVVSKISPDGTRTVVAGTGEAGSSGDGGPARAARLDGPKAVAVGHDGTLYIADDRRVRRVGPDGIISTYVGSVAENGIGSSRASDITPLDVAVDRRGSLYIADASGNRIIKVAPDRRATIVADEGASDSEPADVISSEPRALAVADDGSLYFVDRDARGFHAVRRLGPQGRASVVTGTDARSARLSAPTDVAVAPDGTLYVADAGNHRVQAIGSPGRNSIAATLSVAVRGPGSVDVRPDGSLLVGTSDRVIRSVEGGKITTFADLSPDDAAAPRAADFAVGLVTSADVDPMTGELYFVDLDSKLRRIDRAGRVHTVDLAPPEAPFSVQAVAVGLDGTPYVASTDAVWKLPKNSTPVLVAGRGAAPVTTGKLARAVSLRPYAIEMSPDGALYIADAAGVLRVEEDGRLTVALKQANAQRYRIAPARDGVVYVADTDRHRVDRYDRYGKRTHVAGNGADSYAYHGGDRGDGNAATKAPLPDPGDITVAEDGTLYVSTAEDIRRVDPDGTIDTVFVNVDDESTNATFGPVVMLEMSGNGDLYFGQLGRIAVMARPGEISTASWYPLAWAVGAGLLVACGLLLVRRRSAAATRTSGD